MTEKTPLLTEKQLAERWGMSPATLRQWRVAGNNGRYPVFIKIGRLVRYRLSDIEAYEASI